VVNVPDVEVKGYRTKPNWFYHDLGFVGVVAEFLARLLGVVIPSSSFVERRVRDEYVQLVEQSHEVGEIVDNRNANILCPSYPFTTSARIIAKRPRTSRSFRYLDKQVPSSSIDEGLNKKVKGSRDVRVSGQCVTARCSHWTGSSCQLGSAVARVQLRVRPPKNCSIRESCRWYLENSDNACKTCKFLPYSTLFDLVQIED
jgi:hypothetical protein